MKPYDLRCRVKSILAEGGTHITLIPIGAQSPPPGFPPGDLVMDGHDGDKVYRYDAAKVLAWLEQFEKVTA